MCTEQKSREIILKNSVESHHRLHPEGIWYLKKISNQSVSNGTKTILFIKKNTEKSAGMLYTCYHSILKRNYWE